MNNETNQLGKRFLRKWIVANGLGWIVGAIGAFILSYLIVNIFYPKETNLILGLCIGAGVGYAQWFVLKSEFKISSLWGLVSTVCLGIPFIALVVMSEIGLSMPSPEAGSEILGRLLFGMIMGMIIGLLQMQFLKPFFKNAPWWIVVSMLGWGTCFLASAAVPMPFAALGMLAGGVLLGIITGFGMIWMYRSAS